MECVYRIRNMVNGRVYIGATKNFGKRVSQHRHRLNCNLMKKSLLQEDWNTYSGKFFAFEPLYDTAGMTPREIAELKMQYINDYGGLTSDRNYNLLTPVAFEHARIAKCSDAAMHNMNARGCVNTSRGQSAGRKQVYVIRNNMDCKSFIGFSGVASKKLIEHKFKLQSGCHEIEDLQRDWNVYGPEVFSFELRNDITEADFNTMKLTSSPEYLYEYPKKSKKRKPMSEETKEKIRKSMTGHVISDETRAKISKSMKSR